MPCVGGSRESPMPLCLAIDKISDASSNSEQLQADSGKKTISSFAAMRDCVHARIETRAPLLFGR